MDTLGKLLGSKMGKSVLARQINAGLIIEYANELIVQHWGKFGKEKAEAISLKNHTLTVHVQVPIMAQEFKFKQNKFIHSINTKFGQVSVKRIKIVIKGLESFDKY